jgi:hypothetical protein
MGLRKTLATTGLCAILSLGAANLGGCSNVFDSVRSVQSAEYYSQLEDRVYSRVDRFSRDVPSEFIKHESSDGTISYYDSSFKMPPGENFKEEDVSGDGRFVTKNSQMINAGYLDTEEAKEAKRTGDIKILKKVFGFTKQLNTKRDSYGLVDDYLSFMEGSEGVIYIQMDGIWRRKEVTLNKLGNSASGNLNDLKALPSVTSEQVQRYMRLAERLDNTYFKGMPVQ